MAYSQISPDEIRGREAVRKAVEEARQEQRRKHQLLEGEVQKGTDKFLHGTDGVSFSGVTIDVEKKDLRSIIDKEKRIETMTRLGTDEKGKLDPEWASVIVHAQSKLVRDRTILLAASFRGPQRLELTDHREPLKKQGLGAQLRGMFGRVKENEVVQVETEEE